MLHVKEKKKRDLTSGSILKGFLAMAIPLILSGILNRLFNTADTVMVGRWGGDTMEERELALAAVGSCGAFVSMLFSAFSGLSAGTSLYIAREIGANDRIELEKTVRTSVTVSFVCGLLCMAVGLISAREILVLMGTDEALLDDATLYMRAYCFGVPASMTYVFCSGMLIASGDSVRPLAFLSVSGVVNVLLNAVTVIGLKMGAFGVGIATAASHWTSVAMILIYMSRTTGPCRIPWRRLRIDFDKLKALLGVGIPTTLQGLLYTFSNALVQSAINVLGPVVVAGNTAAANIEGYIDTVQSSFSQTNTTFVGQHVGARKVARLRRVMLTGVAVTATAAIVLGVGAFLLGEPLLELFAPGNTEVISAGMYRITVLFLPFALYHVMSILLSSLRSMGKVVLSTVLLIVGCGLFRILWIELLYKPFFEGNLTVLYLGYPVGWLLTALVAFIAVLSTYRRFARENQSAPLPSAEKEEVTVTPNR